MSYLKNIFTTGAVSETPSRVLQRIAKEVQHPISTSIIELGAGKGEITKKIVENFDPASKFYAFEINHDFATELKRDFPQIIVHEENALFFDNFILEKADLIICSLPLSFFVKKDRLMLLEKIKDSLNNGGKAIILFHAFWIIRELKIVFPSYKLIKLFHIPPYYIVTFIRNS